MIAMWQCREIATRWRHDCNQIWHDVRMARQACKRRGRPWRAGVNAHRRTNVQHAHRHNHAQSMRALCHDCKETAARLQSDLARRADGGASTHARRTCSTTTHTAKTMRLPARSPQQLDWLVIKMRRKTPLPHVFAECMPRSSQACAGL